MISVSREGVVTMADGTDPELQKDDNGYLHVWSEAQEDYLSVRDLIKEKYFKPSDRLVSLSSDNGDNSKLMRRTPLETKLVQLAGTKLKVTNAGGIRGVRKNDKPKVDIMRAGPDRGLRVLYLRGGCMYSVRELVAHLFLDNPESYSKAEFMGGVDKFFGKFTEDVGVWNLEWDVDSPKIIDSSERIVQLPVWDDDEWSS